MLTRIVFLSLLPISLSLLCPVFGEELKILESQLNKNSITGTLQNQYHYPISNILVRAEFYDKDGQLIGLRDFGWVSKDVLEPNEKSSYKVWEHAGETVEFPKTDFIVKAEGIEYRNDNNNEGGGFADLINDANKLTAALNNVTEAAEKYMNKTSDINMSRIP